LTFYSYKPKKSTFGQSGGTTLGTPYQPVAFEGSAPSGAGELQSGLFSQGSRSAEHGFPERVPPSSLDYMGGLNAAVKIPAHTLERPLAILNVLTGAKNGQMGAVDHLMNAIGQVGLGSSEKQAGGTGGAGGISIASLWGGVSEVLKRSNDFIPALMNSTDSRLAAATASLPDNFVLDPHWLQDHGFDPTAQRAGGGIFGFGNHQKTVGELRTELAKRGFNVDSATGKEISWEEFAQKINKPGDFFAQFMQGDKAINDNELVNMASRLAFDPINLAFGAGVVGRVAKVGENISMLARGAEGLRGMGAGYEAAASDLKFASWAQNASFKLSAPGRALSRVAGASHNFGAGYLDDMVKAGIRSTHYASPEISAGYFAKGLVANTTLRGLGFAMRSYVLPGTGSLLRRYARGALRTEATLGGAEFLAGRLHDAFPNIPIISGFLSDAHDVSQAFMGNRPLSDNQIFVFASAFAFPGITLAREDLSRSADVFRNMTGDGTVAYLGRRWGTLGDAPVGERIARVARDPLGKHRGTAKEQSVIDAFGGKAGLAAMRDHMHMRIAYNRLIESNPWVRGAFNSFDEAVARGRNIAKRTRDLADSMIADRKITPQMVADMFEDFAKNHAETRFGADGLPLTNVPQAVRFDNLTFTQMVSQWKAYESLQNELASRFKPTADAIVGRAGRLTQEDVSVLIASVKAGAKNGRVPTRLMTDVLLEHPAMFEDPSLSPAEIDFWKSLMTLGVAAKGDAPVGGRLSRLARSKDPTYAEQALLNKLEGIRATAPPAKELFGEAAAAEARAVPEPVQAGPLATGGNREIYTQASLGEYRASTQSNAHALTKEYVRGDQEMKQNWTKNGGPRKGGKLDQDLARRNIRVTPDEYDTIRRQGEAILDAGTHEPATMAPFEQNRDHVIQELYARAQESYGGATYDPHTGEFLVGHDTAPSTGPYLYHGSQPTFMPGIAKSGMRTGSNWIADAERARSYAIGEGAPIYRAAGSTVRGIEKAKGWVEGGRVDPSKMEVSVDGGKTWKPVVAQEGPYVSSVGRTVSLTLEEAANPTLFAKAVDDLIAANKALLDRSDFHIGVFRDDAFHQVNLDVNVVNATHAEATAVQTALGRTGGAYDFTTTNGVFGVNPDWVEYIAQRERQAIPSMTEEQARDLGTIADVAARSWAQKTGRSPNEMYAKFLGGIEKGLKPTEEALFQAAPLAPGAYARIRNKSVRAAREVVQARADELHTLIDQPAPAVLVKAGMADAAPIEWSTVPGLAHEVGIPGGIKGLKSGTFSLWDLWRLKAQAINPAKLPRAIVQPLYAKIFRSQVRSLETDSMDSFNRMVFALHSRRSNLTANEAVYSALRMRNLADVRDMAGTYDRVLATGVRPEDPRFVQALGEAVQREHGIEAGTTSYVGVDTQVQAGNTVLLARRYLEHPDFFLKKPDESLLEYVERLSAVTPGAGIKIANLGVMVGDPISHPLGTIDTHMMQLMGLGGPGAKAPAGQSIDYRVVSGEINPRVPLHLRDLPWEPKRVTVLGGDYAKAHDMMVQMQSAEGTPFKAGAYQWFKWDQQRGGLEPHTLIYPGAYKLPKMSEADRASAFETQRASGYGVAGENTALTGQPFAPREGFLYQQGIDGNPNTMTFAELRAKIRELSGKSYSTVGGDKEAMAGLTAHNKAMQPYMDEIVRRDKAGLITDADVQLQGGPSGPRGETEFVDQVKGIMRAFDSANFSTGVHEFAHVYRRVLTDFPEDLAVIEKHLGVQGGVWERPHEEAFAKQVENYLMSGKAANPELQGVFDRFKEWLSTIYKGIKGQKVKIHPEVRKALDNLFSETKTEDYWAPIRRAHQEHLNVLREQVKTARREVRAIDKELEHLRTAKVDPRFLDESGNPMVSPESLANLQDQTLFVAQHYPQYDIEPAPRLALQYRPDDSHLAALMQERTNLGRMVLDYGPLSKMFRIVEAVTSPVRSKAMAIDARQMVANKLIPLGFTPSEIRMFFQQLQSKAGNEGPTIGRLQQPLFSGITALTPNTISQALRDAAGGNELAIKNFAKKYGGVDRAHVMLDESYNAGVRRVDTKLLQGHTPNALEAAFRAGYYAWTTLPVLRTASDSTRLLAKVFYPMFRFQMDLRWQTLNLIEADLMSFFRDGVKATHAGRLTGQRDMLVPRGPKGQPINLSDNAVALHMTQAGVPIPRMSHRIAEEVGTSPDLPRSLQDETGMQMTNRVLYGVLKREFDTERPDTIMRVLDALPETDPVLKVLIKKFGMDRGTWSDQIGEMLYSFDKKGVRHTVIQASKEIQKYEKWTPTEREMMVPLVDKIIQRNQELMDDLLASHVGNVNRSRLERVMNSYWLYWPLSYQIKSARWMVKVLGERALGQNSNLGGAWDVTRMVDIFKQQANVSPDFAKQMEDLSPIWFMASMLLPTVPWDPGVSLNRFARYTGGNILGLWDSYSGLDTPTQWAQKFFSMGPIYSINLAGQIAHAAFPDQADTPDQPNQ
jgi:hypothetical protein